MSFKVKEDTHIVLKIEDLKKYASPVGKAGLQSVISAINSGRLNEGKKINNYLVINVDEPYSNEIREVIKRGEEAKERAKKISLKEAWNGLLDYVEELSILPKEDQQFILDKLDTIRPLLIYPTEQEVCEKLSKFLQRDVYYKDRKFRLLSFTYGEIVDLNLLDQEHVALVGKFFEGLENNQ